MPWKEVTVMSERIDFINEINSGENNVSELCRHYGISRTTGYKWLRRYIKNGSIGLIDRSRRPFHSPNKVSDEIESAILEVRSQHPSWGGVKILAYLKRHGWSSLPAASTATVILQRNGQIDLRESCKHRPMQRFERPLPNDLWQMDFKGYLRLKSGNCHPLTILDDHSRFLVGLYACSNQQWQTVQGHLIDAFRYYGLPESMLMDNGSPWGDDLHNPHTILTIWLMRLGITVIHGRPYHPQTQGKDERLHRTLQAEVIDQIDLRTMDECQNQFNVWRQFYNFERPHQALGHAVPAEHYHPSLRKYPEVLQPIQYEPGEIVRKVDTNGKIWFRNHKFFVGRPFCYCPVALKPTETDGQYLVYFCNNKVAQINFREDNS
jgi:transposase InsO family protein